MRNQRTLRIDEGGQVAVTFAVILLPLLIGMTFTLDVMQANRHQREFKSVLDSAVLAAVQKRTLTPDQRAQYAEDYFNEHYQGSLALTLKSDADSNRVHLEGAGDSPVSISSVLGFRELRISQESAAEYASQSTICVLALEPKSNHTIRFMGDLRFLAPTCTVFANSTSPRALQSVGKMPPTAHGFCAAGSGTGDYDPPVDGECAPVADPYARVAAPTPGVCKPGTLHQSFKGAKGDEDVDDDLDDDLSNTAQALTDSAAGTTGINAEGLAESTNRVLDNAVLTPGTYCGGLTVDGRSVRFLPGDYIMLDGPLTLKNGASATADRVTFTFNGKHSTLNIESGADLQIRAPQTGDRKGLAFMEDRGNAQLKPKLPTDRSRIRQGGSVTVTGTVYLPYQHLVVQGHDTHIGATAPATSFIANRLTFNGQQGSMIEVKIDSQVAGIPPILPRSEEGARLVY